MTAISLSLIHIQSNGAYLDSPADVLFDVSCNKMYDAVISPNVYVNRNEDVALNQPFASLMWFATAALI